MKRLIKYLAVSALTLTLFATVMSGTIVKAASPVTKYISGSANVTNMAKASAANRIAPIIKMRTAGGSAVLTGRFSKRNVIVTVYDAKLSSKTVKRNGAAISWPSNNIFKADGSYVIKAKDKSGSTSSSSFKIDKTAPVIKLKTSDGKVVSNDGIADSSVTAAISDTNLSSKASMEDDKLAAWPSGSIFAADGSYSITANDKAGNSTTVTFTVDTQLNSTWSKTTGMDGLKVYEYGKSLLKTDEEKAAYDQIDNTISNLKSNVTVKGNFDIDNCGVKNSFRVILSYVISDHPEFFYLGDIYSSYVTKNGSASASYNLKYLYKAAQISEMRADIGTAAKKILAEADSKTTELDKETTIHDAIVNSCNYDVDEANAVNQRHYDDTHPETFSIYGVFKNNSAVCEGYAKAMQLLFDSENIKTLFVTSSDHAWNMVQISNKWYYLDATWDDPCDIDYTTNLAYSLNKLSHEFFNYSSGSIAANEHDEQASISVFDPNGDYLPSNYQILPAA